MSMSYFDQILSRRGKTKKDIAFLWELRLTDREYSDLKEVLREDARDQRFSDIKAAALYYAEWWRRDFNGGHVGIDDPCRTLLDGGQLREQLYQAAQRGATELGVQIITTRGEQREIRNTMYSLFYQGGLPMNYTVQGILSRDNNGWNTFIKQLVWNQQDFSNVNGLGEIATRSDSMHGFCEKLRAAADSQNPSLQPYYHNDLWWNVVVRQFEESKRERRARTPFELSWIFKFDHRGSNLTAGARISGQSTLSEEFVAENNLAGREFTAISVLLNDRNIYTAEYDQRFYCRRPVKLKFQYNIGDTITISLNDGEKILSKKVLDFESPKILFCKDDDESRFYLGEPHHLKDHRCRIVASNDWHSVCDHLGEHTTYEIGDQIVNVFNITDTNNIITLRNSTDGEIKRFDPAQSICKTFIDYYKTLQMRMPVKEHIFDVNAEELLFSVGDEHRSRLVDIQDVYYSPKGERQWANQPTLGEIKARVQVSDNEYSEPVHFINSGNLQIGIINSSRDECQFNISWEYGDILSDQAIRTGEYWTITRNALINNRYCVLTFRPRLRYGSEFKLTLIPPFHDFCIFDQDDNRIEERSIIPLVDINNYRYYFNSPLRYRLRFDSDRDNHFEYQNDDNTGAIVSEILATRHIANRQIAHEGPLGSLFLGGSEQIEQKINGSCRPLPYVRTYVNITDFENRTSSYTVKPFPLRLERNDNIVTITNATPALSYNGDIFALPFDEPGLTPVKLIKSTDNCYILPIEMFSSPYDHWLVYGDRQGYILPTSVKMAATDVQEEYTETNNREATRADKLREIKECLLNEPMFSESWKKALNWYKMLPQGCIPGTSILELVAIADDSTLPMKFALHLWVDALHSISRVRESIEYLECSLNDFSKEMSFLWSWCAIPSLEEMNRLTNEIFKCQENSLEKCYLSWTLTLPTEVFNEAPDLIKPDKTNLSMAFIAWISQIRENNRPSRTQRDPDVNNHGRNQDHPVVMGLSSNIAMNYFTQKFNEGRFNQNLSPNDQWISVRQYCDNKFKDEGIDTLPGDEHTRREIRKSVINGLRYMTQEQIEERRRRGGRRRRN